MLTGILLAGLPGSALAATYTASDEATLRQAILNANADADASSTITLTSNIVLSSATAFPAAAKPITINSGIYALQGAQGVGTTGQGTSLSFGGGNLTLVGTFAGGSATTVNSTAAGRTGVVMTGGSVSVAGSVTGGAGGNTARTGSAGRNSGAGGAGMATTNVQVVNQAGSTITGGAGGVYDQGNFAFSQNSTLGGGGTGLTMTNATGGSLDNRGVIRGGAGGTAINLNAAAYTTNGGVGGTGAAITGGNNFNSGTIAGGIGGAGLSRSGVSASGAGGTGLTLAQGVLTNSGTIIGGNGRAGGGGIIIPGNTPGSEGGVGVVLTGGSTLNNSGTIRGGNAGGTVSIPGDAITGNGNVTVVNSGTIAAGTGAPLFPANAITFTGGNNSLLLYAGSTITGNVVGTGTDQLLLRGTGNASLAGAQYQGFGRYEKLDSATWTLTGTATNVTPWTVTGGVLAVSADANLGATSGALTLNGGTLQVTGTAFTSMARSVRLTAASGIDIASAANTLAIVQPITGAGALTKLGAGTLAMAGASTYTGGTTITAGTLQIGAGGTTGSIVGDVTNNARLALNRSNAIAFAGVISGTGTVAQIGTGVTTLTGTNTYTGGTAITAGTLRLGNGGTTGSIVGDVANAGTLAFNRADAFEFAGVISGTGAVSQSGSGTTTLTGASTYSGGTTITAGTLSIGNGGIAGSIVGDVANAGTLAFNRADALDFAGAISGTGAVSQIGGGVTTLTGTSTYTGGTSIAAGTLSIGNGGTTGSIVGDVSNAGTLAFNRADALAFAGAISGTGAVSQIGSGVTTLTGASTYTGGTTIAAGTLSIGNGEMTGSIVGDVANAGTLVFNRADALDFAGGISGTGAVSQSGSGITTLTGANTYTGGTTIAAGTLSIGNGGIAGSIVGDVANAGTLVFNRADALAFAGAISGTGAVSQIGTGTTSLTGNSGAFSGAVTVTGGTLSVDGTLGSAASTVAVSNGGTLGGAGMIGGNVTIADGVLAPGNSVGTLTINGNLALGAATQVNYELGAANTVGGALNDLTVVGGDLTLDGTLNVSQTTGGTYGAGIYRLFNYTGTLTDNGLTLGMMPAGTTNYVQTSVANQVNLVNSQGLTLNFWDGDAGGRNDGVIAGGSGTWRAGPTGGDQWTQADGTVNAPYQNPSFAIFSGTPGTVTVDNSLGQIAVSGLQFATSGYRIQGGNIDLTTGINTIRVGDGTAAGASTTATIASALTGGGGLDKTDAGTLVLSGTNTYGGGTRISGGTLQLGEGGTTGSIVGNVTNNGTLALNRSDATSFTGVISGTGTVAQIGTGTTTLTGGNTYSGGTLIAAGTLTGSATSFGAGSITDNAGLVISQPGDATFANAINGSGTFAKTGSGTLTLTGTSALTGATTVTQGTLAVSGSLASSAVTVGNGATLTGTGTVGATTLQAGSTIAPGAGSIGTLNVRGNLAQAVGSIYQVQVDSATMSSSDRISVTGTATIASGAILNVTRTGTSPYSLNSKYVVLSATGGVSGKYTLTGDTRTAFVQLIDTYDATTAYLTASQIRSFAAAGQMPNQIATGGALDTLDASSPLRNALAFLPDDGSARAAFDQLSGEQHASAQTALMNDSRFVREAATDRLLGAFCSPGAASETMTQAESDRGGCAPTTDGAIWGRAFASSGRFDGDGNARTVKRDIGGVFLGADTALGGGWRVGGLGGFSHTTLQGSAKTDDYHLGAYAGNQWDRTSLRLGASYSWHTLDTRRSVAFTGFADSLSAKYDGSTAQVFGEIGQRLDVAKGVAIEPIAGLAYVSVKTDGYTERGGAAALTAGKASFDTTISTLGARFDASLDDHTALRGLIGWRHAFGDVTPEVTQAFAGSAPFTVSGVPLARNAAVIDAGVETALRPNIRVSASYSGQFGGKLRDNGPKVSLAFRF